jgi:3-phenylpropionate/trans-cinnamate dioxygenase ferredoxin reductase subunit
MQKIAIIGNGISGITAARWIRKFDRDCIIKVISQESDYFFSRTALMYVYMGHMRWKDIEPYEKEFWEKNRIQLINDTVTRIEFKDKTAYLDSGTELKYDKLILATGSVSFKPEYPGVQHKGVSGLYSKQDLGYIESLSHSINKAVIVGGGLIGIELAEMFHSRNIPVTFLVREKEYCDNLFPSEEANLISRHIKEHHIDLRLDTHLKEITCDINGHVNAIITSKDEKIDCEFVGLTVGVRPNIHFLDKNVIECDRGILVNEFLETNINDVYAIGDCAQLRQARPGRKTLEPIWYTGRMMGETIAKTICGNKTEYNPGIWFNSAKFFDIEYQVYGTVPAKIELPLESFYWEDFNGKKSMRIVFDQDTAYVKGFNLMGIRFRQEVCERWIKKRTNIDEVVSDIRLAFFDPEFFEDVAPPVIEKYNRDFNKNLVLRSSNSLNAVLQFFKKNPLREKYASS